MQPACNLTTEPRSSSDPKKNFSTSSTVRGVLIVVVILPKAFGALMSRPGGPKLFVLVKLNASARNSIAAIAGFSWSLLHANGAYHGCSRGPESRALDVVS